MEQENSNYKNKERENIENGAFEEVTEKVENENEKLKNKNIDKQKKVKPPGDINPATDTAAKEEKVPPKEDIPVKVPEEKVLREKSPEEEVLREKSREEEVLREKSLKKNYLKTNSL